MNMPEGKQQKIYIFQVTQLGSKLIHLCTALGRTCGPNWKYTYKLGQVKMLIGRPQANIANRLKFKYIC